MSCEHLVTYCAKTTPTDMGSFAQFTCLCFSNKQVDKFKLLLHLFGTIHSARSLGERSKKENITQEVSKVQTEYYNRFKELTLRFFNVKQIKQAGLAQSCLNQGEIMEIIKFIHVVDFPLQVGMRYGIEEIEPVGD